MRAPVEPGAVNQLVRYWVLIGSLLLSVGSLLYLFLSFLFPSEGATATAPEVRLAAIGLALVGVSLFVWVALLDPDNGATVPPTE